MFTKSNLTNVTNSTPKEFMQVNFMLNIVYNLTTFTV